MSDRHSNGNGNDEEGNNNKSPLSSSHRSLTLSSSSSGSFGVRVGSSAGGVLFDPSLIITYNDDQRQQVINLTCTICSHLMKDVMETPCKYCMLVCACLLVISS
jgi:hypothetical protein